MKTLILLRGLPGSGKSTFAKQICNQYVEADMYFELDGGYNFDATKLHQAHEWCKGKTEEWMKKGYNVAVSNTSTTDKELEPYLKLAEKYDYKVVSLVVENRHGNKSVHNVPDETMERMKQRFSIKL